MCGFIFQKNKKEKINIELFKEQLNRIKWRGPDFQKIVTLDHGKVQLGHCRLSIIDPYFRSNQPMISHCGNYYILFNGEIYNHKEIRKELRLECETESDTETILQAYAKIGKKLFERLDGMFSIIIYDALNNTWVASRDAFGIKPLFIARKAGTTVISSEAVSIANIINAKPCKESLSEWEIIRRPIPGKSFFEDVNEVLPGTTIDSEGNIELHWQWKPTNKKFSQAHFEKLLVESIKFHELSDVDNVSLLSGGLDSAIIAKISSVKYCYTIGLPDNNEFSGAKDTAVTINKKLNIVSLTEDELKKNWQYLTRIRGEPLCLPNEGLIYHVCKNMNANEKVVLTGEGADELLFGYDDIFRWCLSQKSIDSKEFLLKYGYTDKIKSERLIQYVDELKEGKSPVEFLEDFFYQVHLPGLLRRMDFASMAASKESRVPFVSKNLISYLYRQPSTVKISHNKSKIPIRKFAENLELKGALERKKIGFSATPNKEISRIDDYALFREIILEELGW